MGLFFKAPQFYYNFLNPEQKKLYFIDKLYINGIASLTQEENT